MFFRLIRTFRPFSRAFLIQAFMFGARTLLEGRLFESTGAALSTKCFKTDFLVLRDWVRKTSERKTSRARCLWLSFFTFSLMKKSGDFVRISFPGVGGITLAPVNLR